MGGAVTKTGLVADGDGLFGLKLTASDMTFLAGCEGSSTLAEVCKRSGVQMPQKGSQEEHGAATKLQAKQRQRLTKAQSATDVTEDTLAAVFFAFCAYGKRGGAVTVLDGRQFQKMMKDCKIVNKKFNGNAVDLLFAKCITKGSKTMTKDEWMQSIELVGEKTGKGVDWVKKNLVVNGVPQSSGTKAEGNRFYDDKSTWTATAVNGGPTNVDNKPTLESQANRDNKADVRGVVS